MSIYAHTCEYLRLCVGKFAPAHRKKFSCAQKKRHYFLIYHYLSAKFEKRNEQNLS